MDVEGIGNVITEGGWLAFLNGGGGDGEVVVTVVVSRVLIGDYCCGGHFVDAE